MWKYFRKILRKTTEVYVNFNWKLTYQSQWYVSKSFNKYMILEELKYRKSYFSRFYTCETEQMKGYVV